MPSSGISKNSTLPQVLPYPELLPFDTTLSIRDIFCYVVRHYGNSGLSVLIYRQPQQDQVVTICGDWNGNNIDLIGDNTLATVATQFVKEDLLLFLQTMQLVKLEQAQFFFALADDQLVLVDMQIALNKFASPGMIGDIFGKIYRTQEILKTEIIDERSVEFIGKGTGSYEGDLVLKPSRFRLHHDPEDQKFQPLYVEVRR